MAKLSKPRAGSLQFWPRKRAKKFLHSVNWNAISTDAKQEGLLGFIAYKAGMSSAIVKDSTDKSMTSGKKIFIPVTILEAPNMKVFAIRFYKEGIPVKDIIVSNDKELKRITKIPKTLPQFMPPKEYDDIRLLVYSLVKNTSLKKTPDIAEIAFNAQNKLEYAKSLIGKEISIKDFKHSLIDIRGLTTGKGFSSAVKRYHISLKQHKSEKGRRRPGSLGPWHPARVTFRTPMAGQLGMFSRIQYNQRILSSSQVSEKEILVFPHYGKINSSYIVLTGSVQGPEKRQVLITTALRPTKKQLKKKYEFQELIR